MLALIKKQKKLFPLAPKKSWRETVIGLSFLSAFFTSIYKTFDCAVISSLIPKEEFFIGTFAYFVIASWVGVIISLIFSYTFGRKLIDSDFKGISLGNFQAQLSAFSSGLLSALSTFFYLFAIRYTDPGTIITLGSMVVVYTMIYDLFKKKVCFKNIRIPFIFVLLGGFMASYSGSFKITIMGLLLIGVLSNLTTAISEEIEQYGVKRTDSVNFFFFRFLWLSASGTIMAIITALITNKTSSLISLVVKLFDYFPLFILIMFFVFLGIGFKLTAKKRGVVSIILMIISIQIIFGYLFTFLGNFLVNGIFGEIPLNPILWLIRILGALILTFGIVFLINPRFGKLSVFSETRN